MTTKADPIAAAEAAEIKRADGWKAKASVIKEALTKAHEARQALEAEFEAAAPRTLAGSRALAEVRAIFSDGTALDRIAARVTERRGTALPLTGPAPTAK